MSGVGSRDPPEGGADETLVRPRRARGCGRADHRGRYGRCQHDSDQGYCIRIKARSKGSWECNWTTFLENGHITVEGPFFDTKDSKLAITGGTGAYRDARGVMELKSRAGGTKFDFIFHFAG